MSNATEAATDAGRELVLSRVVPVPRALVWRAWTEPELLKQWFAPRPWTTPKAEMDVRPGGTTRSVMRSPDGAEYDNSGVFLEVVPGERLVFTDAYVRAWEPSEKPFMTVELTLEDAEGGTLYTARARHWTAEDREAHEKMGFHEGWGQCLDQLVELVRGMKA
jgi:uncharacterized protein YndB with AHSA1/START domain